MPFIAQKQNRVAFMGNWTARYGLNQLSAVMIRVLTKNPTVYFDVYGTGGANEQPAILCNFDDIDAMENAVLRLLDDEEMRIKTAKNGWERVGSLTSDANINKLSNLYCQWTASNF